MIDMKHQIAARLHMQFQAMGFAAPGVEALRESADVSLRTLYKYFPSREAMVVGALDHRDRTYAEWISGGPEQGAAHVLHVLQRLADWLLELSNTGCLFRNALAAYPESDAIRTAVQRHKTGVQDVFRSRLCRAAPACDAQTLSAQMFILHEGLTEAALLMNPADACAHTLKTARQILCAAGIKDPAPQKTN